MEYKKPHSFRHMPLLWIRFFQMTKEFFVSESVLVDNKNTIINVIISTFIYSLFLLADSIINPSQFQSKLLWLILHPIIFFSLTSIFCFGARMLGGGAEYKTQLYIYSIISVPLGLINNVLLLGRNISYLDTVILILSNVVAIYGLILFVRASNAIHGINTLKSLVAIFIIPMLLFALIGCLIVTLYLKLMESGIGSYFSHWFISFMVI